MQLNPPVLMPVWMTVIAIIGVSLAVVFILAAAAGYAVTVALDGVDGNRRIQEAPWDVIVLDRMLPHEHFIKGVEGAQVFREVVDDQEFAGIVCAHGLFSNMGNKAWMAASGRTRCGLQRRIASSGMTGTWASPGACTTVRPPQARMCAMPPAPSWLAPVSRMPARPVP